MRESCDLLDTRGVWEVELGSSRTLKRDIPARSDLHNVATLHMSACAHLNV